MIPLRDNIGTKKFPLINWLLIGANFYFFYIEMMNHSQARLDRFINHWAVVPKLLFSHPDAHAYSLVSAMFLHGGWLHILSNMLFLYVFGGSVEDRMGHIRYMVFYFIVGVMANGTQAYFSQHSAVPFWVLRALLRGCWGLISFIIPMLKSKH